MKMQHKKQVECNKKKVFGRGIFFVRDQIFDEEDKILQKKTSSQKIVSR